MNYTNIRNLGQTMNQLEKKRVEAIQSYNEAHQLHKRTYDELIDGLSFKQWQKWTHEHGRKLENVCKVTKSKKLLELAAQLSRLNVELIQMRQNTYAVYNEIELTAQAQSLRIVQSNPYSWYELTMLKLNRVANTRIHRQNPAGLKLVG